MPAKKTPAPAKGAPAPGKAVPAKAPGTAVAKPTPSPTAVSADLVGGDDMLSKMMADAQEGNNIRASDLSIPFLRILQPLSPQVQVRGEKYVAGAVAGDFFNTGTNRLVPGEAGVLFIPAWYTPAYTEWKLREKGGGFVKSYGPMDPRLPVYRDDKSRDILLDAKGQLTEHHLVFSMDYYGMLMNEEGDAASPVILSLTVTQLKKARKWNTRIEDIRAEYNGVKFRPPMYFMAWRLTSLYESNDKGSWFGLNIPEPEVRTQDLTNGVQLLRDASQFRDAVKAGNVRGKMDEVEVTDAEVEAGGQAGGAF